MYAVNIVSLIEDLCFAVIATQLVLRIFKIIRYLLSLVL